MDDFFVCDRCGNQDPRYLGLRNGKPYCRRCITFSGEEAPDIERRPSVSPLVLHYPLSEDQSRISNQVRNNYKQGIETLIYAVCGAGKTELVFGVIADVLRQGKRVGFAVPRKDVVIELAWRLRDAFPSDHVVAVYGEHADQLTGDIIVLTTHQLYRYPHYFDLLVMDEIDAFPFAGNEVLEVLAKRSVRGHLVLMSATPSNEVLREFRKENHAIIELRTRFHKHEIPVPVVLIRPLLFQFFSLLKRLRKYQREKKPVFVFCPTIAECESFYRWISFFVKGGAVVHSKKTDREQIVADFKKGIYSYLVTSSVLERGVTVKNLQVMILKADDERIYDSSTLIQIAGRVGRKIDAPSGDVFFLASDWTQSMRKAIDEIEYCNCFL